MRRSCTPVPLLAHEIIHPHTRTHDVVARMMCSPRAVAASAADLAPPPLRPGSEDAHQFPSRIGDSLHYRDGRIDQINPQEP